MKVFLLYKNVIKKLIPINEKKILPGSIVSDEWRTCMFKKLCYVMLYVLCYFLLYSRIYSCLKNRGYNYRTVNHSKNVVDLISGTLTQAIEYS
jgi:hypothetical protein